ncbi:MAG: DUF1574 domain-containing protein [Candidatus Obscuribacterales bacterium]|nr:DUF1574 domain-containing protein [Candidatus Obscuribacterales bacterium]
MVATATQEKHSKSSDHSDENSRPRSPIATSFSSTTILAVLLIVAINSLIVFIDPLDKLYWTGLTGARQNVLVSKLPKIIASRENPDVLFMGSSVCLYPAIRADDRLDKVRARWDFWYERNVIYSYSKVKYLAHNLSQALNHQISAINTGIAGGMMSDQYLILKKYLASGKKPKLILLCCAPRDFLDNERTEIGKTPTHTVLGDWMSISELVEKSAKWQSIVDVALRRAFDYYAQREDYRHFFVGLTAQKLNHPIDLFSALQKPNEQSADANLSKQRAAFLDPKNVPVYEKPPNKLNQLKEYGQMYLPFNETQLGTQTDYFQKFLNLARKNDIGVVVINTPLPLENINLLPAAGQKKYHAALEKTCRKANVPLLEPGIERPYDTYADFQDAAHMNAHGGVKFFDTIDEFVVKNKEVAKYLR